MELMIGRVIKAHGIRGEVVVEATTDDPEGRFGVGDVLTGRQTNREQHLTISHIRPHQGRLLVTFEEITDRNAAEALRSMRFFAEPREDDGDEGFYDHELEGLRVRHESESGELIGEVTGVTHGAAHNLLEVKLSDDGREVLIPFVEAIVPHVDVDKGELIVTPPDGLLDL